MSEITKDKQIDILLHTIARYWDQAIQNEKQRANFTNYILLILGAVQGYIMQRDFDKMSIILALIVLILSIFGTLVTAKYYERFRIQASRVGRMMDRIKEIEPEIDLEDIERKADKKHFAKFPVLGSMRLSNLWIYFYYFLIALGLIDIFIVWYKINS